MTALDLLFLLSALTALVSLGLGRRPALGWVVTVLYGAQLLALLQISGLGYGSLQLVESGFRMSFMDQELRWGFDALSWFFALITIGAGLFSSWFMAGDWGRDYQARGSSLRLLQFALALNVLSMLILLASGDLLSLFIGWELVSWASFLIMALGGAAATRYAMRYITYAFAGAMAILGAIALVYASTGSIQFKAFAVLLPSLPPASQWSLVILFSVGFGIKLSLIHISEPTRH